MMQRAYLCVQARTDAAGRITPETLVVDGRALPISQVLDCREARATKEGGQGLRYLVCLGRGQLLLFLADDRRWYVEDEKDVREISCQYGG